MLDERELLKSDFSYGYYIDEQGLYFYSELDGGVYECFDINGVSSSTFDFNDNYRIIELAYIFNKNELDNKEEI